VSLACSCSTSGCPSHTGSLLLSSFSITSTSSTGVLTDIAVLKVALATWRESRREQQLVGLLTFSCLLLFKTPVMKSCVLLDAYTLRQTYWTQHSLQTLTRSCSDSARCKNHPCKLLRCPQHEFRASLPLLVPLLLPVTHLLDPAVASSAEALALSCRF
jgi:hypothetical protein